MGKTYTSLTTCVNTAGHTTTCAELVEVYPSLVSATNTTNTSTIRNKKDDSAFAGSFSFIKAGSLAARPGNSGKRSEEHAANYKLQSR